ncbi:RNA ligase/cyclic nucleotide phosphodiesterase [Nemania serpens]|nr:RNA ligase/cyclic nucleotide phosphodiesterase [Nemania serpens]
MGSVLELTDVKNKLEDLSGVELKPGENPYDALIDACHDNPKGQAEIQALYAAHRVRRNAQQKDKFLDANFKELIIDPYLLRLENPHIEPGFKDTRYCAIQKKLKDVAPDIWLMPQHRMHMTTIEVAFCRTPQEIEEIKTTLRPVIPIVASYSYQHRARLVKPMVSYDLSAFAVSFLPVAGEPAVSPAPMALDSAAIIKQGDRYSYHHLRRDMWDLARGAEVDIDSRYIVPSAHITLGRYLSHKDHSTPEQRKKWVDAIDDINEWLESEVWGRSESEVIGEWVVGQEKGFDVRVGNLW